MGFLRDCKGHAQLDKDSANSTRGRICAVGSAHVETDVAQASELMIESAAFSLCEVLEPWTNVLDKEHRLHGVR